MLVAIGLTMLVLAGIIPITRGERHLSIGIALMMIGTTLVVVFPQEHVKSDWLIVLPLAAFDFGILIDFLLRRRSRQIQQA